MSNNNELEIYLQIVHERERNAHNIIWEVEKHFTWWISIIFGSMALVLTADADIINWGIKNILFIGISIMGIFVSLIGLLILEFEGKYFLKLTTIYHNVIKTLKIQDRIHFDLKQKKDKDAYDFLIGNDTRKIKIGVRYFFKILFVIFILFFICIIIFTQPWLT